VSAARRALAGETVSIFDVPVVSGAVSFGPVDVTAQPLEHPNGVALTLTPRSLTRSDAQSGITPPLARALAHELRNPLAGIRAAAQLIGKTADPETRALTDMICAETDRIRRLTDRIDALDSIAAAQFDKVNVHEAMDRARAVVAANFPEVSFREEYDPSLPPVLGDLDLLIQAFLNLTKNAAEAVQERRNPRIILATRYRPGLKIRSSVGRPRMQLEASITDNGPGLPPGLSGRVFEPFVSSKSGGAGLGLAIASAIAARHEGRIEVESQPGKTVFCVLLPLAEDRA
jgi:two-component system nitrogen regulation sensor histidine kinase GlnL